MLKLVNLTKGVSMFVRIALSMIFIISITQTSDIQPFSERTNYQIENKILKLKLQIYEQKEEIDRLKAMIVELNDGQQYEYKRLEAIAELRRQLRRGRKVSLNLAQ
jgi:cell division protein FtsL